MKLHHWQQKQIDMSIGFIRENMKRYSHSITSGEDITDFLTLRFAGKEAEEFLVIFLDTQNRIIADEFMFKGTINKTHVYPREVVKRTLHHNASALFLAHNHPSGDTTPSQADVDITLDLRNSLDCLEVRVLDHFVVGSDVISMVDLGLID